jgi:hypothetical protein
MGLCVDARWIAITHALAQWADGEPSEAERTLRAVLKLEPHHMLALYYLDLLNKQPAKAATAIADGTNPTNASIATLRVVINVDHNDSPIQSLRAHPAYLPSKEKNGPCVTLTTEQQYGHDDRDLGTRFCVIGFH